jgi:hypothetical protein
MNCECPAVNEPETVQHLTGYAMLLLIIHKTHRPITSLLSNLRDSFRSKCFVESSILNKLQIIECNVYHRVERRGKCHHFASA